MTDDAEIIKNGKDSQVTKIIYDCMFHMYEMEWQRTRDIENKATSIVGFEGIIFTLTIGSMSTIIACANASFKDKIFSSSIYSLLLFLILALMILSILCGMLALSIKNWYFLLSGDFHGYCKREEKAGTLTEENIYKDITDNIEELINNNSNKNDQISEYLNCSYSLFFVSIILLVIYFIRIVTIYK